MMHNSLYVIVILQFSFEVMKPKPRYEEFFLVYTGALDCMATESELLKAGIRAAGNGTYPGNIQREDINCKSSRMFIPTEQSTLSADLRHTENGQ